MRWITWVGIIGLTLSASGCSTLWPFQRKDPTVLVPQVKAKPLPPVNIDQPEKFTARFKPHGFSLGAWVVDRFEGDRSLFQRAPRYDAQSALVYLYRPASSWNEQEIIAPSFFINGVRIPTLRSGAYYWIELPAGSYRLTIRRPIGPVYFEKGTVADFVVKTGQNYYLRYDEENFRAKPDPALNLLQTGPVTQMPEQAALKELQFTALKSPGQQFGLQPEVARALPPGVTGQNGYGVKRMQLRDSREVVVGVPFKWYNPLTW